MQGKEGKDGEGWDSLVWMNPSLLVVKLKINCRVGYNSKLMLLLFHKKICVFMQGRNTDAKWMGWGA